MSPSFMIVSVHVEFLDCGFASGGHLFRQAGFPQTPLLDGGKNEPSKKPTMLQRSELGVVMPPQSQEYLR